MSIFLALMAVASLEMILRYGLSISMPGLLFIAIYLVFFTVIDRYRKRRQTASGVDHWLADWGAYPIEDLSELRASGPIKYLGRWGLPTVFFTSQILMLLNPWQFVEVIRQITGNIGLSWRERQTKDNYQHYQNKVSYQLPVQGEWLVLNGGMTPKTSHSWEIRTQRYALDLVKADKDHVRYRGRGTRLNDYYCYGEPIVAAQNGVVVATQDGIEDAPFLGWGLCDVTARSFIGNHVIIKHADGEYGVYAHLQPSSVSVVRGQRVSQGERIGVCGHSGHSTEPHLHFHLQDSPNPYDAMGLPVAFSALTIGGELATNARLRSGYRVNSPRPNDQ